MTEGAKGSWVKPVQSRWLCPQYQILVHNRAFDLRVWTLPCGSHQVPSQPSAQTKAQRHPSLFESTMYTRIPHLR